MCYIKLKDITESNVLLVNISKSFNSCPNSKCATLGSWRLNEDNAKKVEYLFGVYKQQIKCIIAVNKVCNLVGGFNVATFPCDCSKAGCREEEKKYIQKAISSGVVDNKLKRRIYFIEDNTKDVKELEAKYLGKKIFTASGKRLFYNPVRYVNF